MSRYLPFLTFATALLAGCAHDQTPSVEREHPTAASILLDNVRVVDFGPDGVRETLEAAVLIVGERIVEIAPAGSVNAGSETRVIDARGKTLVPGLYDMHVHVWDEAELGAYLAAGVTGVRNMSGMPFHLELARRIDAGDLLGPRLLTTGPILNSPGPNAQINHQMVETADAARAAVQGQANAGYQRIKIYSNMRREAYEAAMDEARALGLIVTGHTPEGERLPGIPQERGFLIDFEEILDDGFETIEHSESILWHGLRDRYSPESGHNLAARIAASGVAVTPTLVAHYNLFIMAQSDGAFRQRAGIDRLNPVAQGFEEEVIAFWSGADPEPERLRAEAMRALTLDMQRAGVLLVAGSDAGIFVNVPGVSLHDELDLLERAGLTRAEVIASATYNGAAALGEEGRSGCVRQGCVADLVLVDCDPLADLRCLRKPEAVIRQGKWLGIGELDRLLAQSAQHNPQRTIANLLEGMAAQGSPLDPAIFGLPPADE